MFVIKRKREYEKGNEYEREITKLLKINCEIEGGGREIGNDSVRCLSPSIHTILSSKWNRALPSNCSLR